MRMKILSIDPGGTTGIAIRMSYITGVNTGDVYTCVLKSPEEVFNMIATGQPEVIICENFQAQTISKYGLHTVRIVGGTYALAHIYKKRYVLHMPQDRYPFLSEAKEILEKRRLTLRQPYMEHEKDALAHLLRFEHDESKQKS